jgi:[NiFe] hydrogenase small subunit
MNWCWKFYLVEYHETIMAAAGHQAEENCRPPSRKYEGKFICVVEGAMATKFNGGYGKVGGRTFLEIAKEIVPRAAATICHRHLCRFGGIQAAKPNPGGYKGVGERHGNQNPEHTRLSAQPGQHCRDRRQLSAPRQAAGTGQPGPADVCLRQDHSRSVPARSHFENDEFVEEFGSEEAAMGYCLYKMGCRGPETYNNCPIVKFNDGTSWPVEAGHPCIGCSEPDFWDKLTPFLRGNVTTISIANNPF